MMKRIATGIFISLATMQSYAAEGINGSVLLATDSIWRGVSQTLNRPSVEGDFYYETKAGFSFGETLDTVNYGDCDPAFIESTTYISYSKSFKNDVSLELTASRFTYPAIHHYDYNEYHAAVTVKNTTATVEYTDNYFNAHYPYYYGEIAYNHDFKKDISAGGSVGYSKKDDIEGNYWNLRGYINKKYKEVKFEAAITATPGRPHDLDNLGGVKVLASISKDFS